MDIFVTILHLKGKLPMMPSGKVRSTSSGNASSEKEVRLKRGYILFGGLIFIAFLGDLRE